MVVKVVGHRRVCGTSKKNGNPFDFWEVFIEHPQLGVSGIVAENVTLNVSDFPVPPVIGADYNLDRDAKGYLIQFCEV